VKNQGSQHLHGLLVDEDLAKLKREHLELSFSSSSSSPFVFEVHSRPFNLIAVLCLIALYEWKWMHFAILSFMLCACVYE
jgi:hypothetical protein